MNSNDKIYYAPWKWLPTPDKYIPTTPMGTVGGFAFDTHGNVHRQYNDFINYTEDGFGVGAPQIQFSNDASMSVFSRIGSTSGYWNHAITMLLSYNDRYRHFNYQNGTLSGMDNIIVLNLGRREYGDRIKSGSFKAEFNVPGMYEQHKFFASVTSDNIDFGSVSSQPYFQYYYPYYSSNNEYLVINNVVSISERFSGTGVVGQPNYDPQSAISLSGQPNYDPQSAVPPSGQQNSITFSETEIIGKLFPHDGIAIISGNWLDIVDAADWMSNNFISIEWDTDIVTTEFHAYCIKEPFILNFTTNPTIFKSSLCALTSNIGYSYGRDGLTGNSGEFIDSISSISTYVTTIGLYNDNDELLFVAKVPQALKIVKELPYSFLVNIDYRIK